MSLNGRVIRALEHLNLPIHVAEHPVNDGEGSSTDPDAFCVIIPLYDDFLGNADDKPIVETEEVELAFYCRGNYLQMRDQITESLIEADISIVSRRYVEFESDTKYHHYIFDVMGIREGEEDA